MASPIDAAVAAGASAAEARAAAETVARLERGAVAVFADALRRYLVSTGVKTALVLGALALSWVGLIDPGAAAASVLLLLAAFLVRDGVLAWPHLAAAVPLARRLGLRPRAIARALVVRAAFAEAYAVARQEAETGPNAIWTALSSHRADRIAARIAASVAARAKAEGVDRIAPHAWIAALKASAVAAAYAGFLQLAFWRA